MRSIVRGVRVVSVSHALFKRVRLLAAEVEDAVPRRMPLVQKGLDGPARARARAAQAWPNSAARR